MFPHDTDKIRCEAMQNKGIVGRRNMAEYKLGITCIQTMTEDVNEQIHLLSRKVLELHQAMDRLQAEWEGEGYATFVSEVEKDMRRLERLLSNLKIICQYEKNAEREYTSCEKKVANYVNEL